MRSSIQRRGSVFKGMVLGVLAACAVGAGTARADVTVTVDPGAINLGFMNVSNLPADGGAYQFGQPWGFGDLTAVYSGNNLTLGPNTIGDPNEYWYKCVGPAVPPNCGGPGAPGNKIMEANAYAQVDGALAGQTVTFVGNVKSNTLTGAHVAKAFIKDFAPDFSSFNGTEVVLPASGSFSLSLATNPDPARHVQWGFQMIGENVWVTDVAPFGEVVVGPPAPYVSINSVSKLEGAAGTTDFDFTISLDAVQGSDVVVCYSTADGSATVDNNDYVAVSSTATIPAGSLSTTVTIKVNGDLTLESDETFLVNLCGASGASIKDPQGNGTILNDDALPSVSIEDVTELEGNSGQTAFDFLLVVSNPSDQPIEVDYYTADGTATLANDDYKGVSATATIPPKTKSITVTVEVNGDTKNEGDETFTVNLANPVGATIGDGVATGTIENDDGAPCISIDDVRDSEGAFPGKTAFVFTVSLSNTTDQDVTFDYITKDGTADGFDYQSTSGTATIAAKTLSTTITVLVNGDNILEIGSGPPDFYENFFVNLSNASGGLAFCDDEGEGQIIDDEATPALMQRFVSTAGEEGIAVTWQFASAAQFSAVVLERAIAEDGPWMVVDADMSVQDGASVAMDRTVEPGTTYYYRLVAEAGDGQILFGPISVTSLTIEFALSNVYPNPMRDVARIDYAVARSAPVKLSVFDIQGREVAVLVDGIQRGGRHQAVWNGRTDGGTAQAGIYFVRYQTPGKNFVKRIAMTR